MAINITDSAIHYLKTRIAQEQGIGFRLSIKKTGCSGYAYQPLVVKETPGDDKTYEIKGLTVYLDSKWLSLLQGVQIDYVHEEKLGLKQKRLVFSNPNEGSRCGCGESFHIESEGM